MLVHTVYFYLKSDLSEEQRVAFRLGVESLKEIAAAQAVYVGAPADTPKRPVVDASFDVGLTVLLEDIAQHDAYQDDPLHHAFLNDFKGYWERIVVYDAE